MKAGRRPPPARRFFTLTHTHTRRMTRGSRSTKSGTKSSRINLTGQGAAAPRLVLSDAEFVKHRGKRAAAAVDETGKVARCLEVRDYSGIHVFVDPLTDTVYNTADVLAGVLDPAPLDAALRRRLEAFRTAAAPGDPDPDAAAVPDDVDDVDEDEEED